MVYVLNIGGKPLMPCKEAKARKLLKHNKAKIYKREPFTIQLLFECENQTQDIVLGVDSGSKHIGLSATTENKELYASDVELRNDIVKLISERSENRRARRSRKIRYRKPRFENRKRGNGWLAPSVKQKIESHLKVIENVYEILPITKIIVETASFDIQKIKNPDIQNGEYQQGEQLGFWNVREYVLFRDNYTCQCCKGKTKDKIMNVHHIESRKTGGNAQNNLITLCETCHSNYHKGITELPEKIKRGMKFQDAAFMGIMRQRLLDELNKKYPKVENTYGYITKHTRIKNKLPKEHYIDARCISGNPNAEPLGYYFYQKKVRCHNRKIHKAKILKGGIKRNNQLPYETNGYRLFDKVLFDGEEYFVFGRRKRGIFEIRGLKSERPGNGAVSFKKIKLKNERKGFIQKKYKQEFCFS